MTNREEDSGSAGILIAVLIGGLLLVGIAAVAFLFLGSTATTSGSFAPTGATVESPTQPPGATSTGQSDSEVQATEIPASEE